MKVHKQLTDTSRSASAGWEISKACFCLSKRSFFLSLAVLNAEYLFRNSRAPRFSGTSSSEEALLLGPAIAFIAIMLVSERLGGFSTSKLCLRTTVRDFELAR